MKELSIEEKAKRYDEAIEKAKEYFNSPRTCFDIEQLCNIFPELTESDDERIRKALLKTFRNFDPNGTFWTETLQIDKEMVVAWLEKQGTSYTKKDVDDAGKSKVERVFPEIKESKDEKIRKWLIRTLKSLNNSPVQIDGAYEMMLPAIAWLEKQGELSNKMKIQQDDIKATDEELILFYRWLNDHELQCQKDGYDDSSALFASIKSMFIEVFGKWITKKN